MGDVEILESALVELVRYERLMLYYLREIEVEVKSRCLVTHGTFRYEGSEDMLAPRVRTI
jgi:hypothetical protein